MPYNFKQSIWAENSIELRLLSHSEWRERDVIEVCTNCGIRIGYLMSASCIETDDEEILDKQQISNYVTTGVVDYFKISFSDLCLNTPPDLQKSNACILLLHKKSFKDSGFDILDIDALLVKLGFSTLDKISSESFFTANSRSVLHSELSNGKITIKKINCSVSVNRTIFNIISLKK